MSNTNPPANLPNPPISIILCKQDMVNAYAEEVNELLLIILGSASALVTDWSQISDFHALSPAQSAQLEDIFGRPVAAREFLGELAKELRVMRDLKAQRAALKEAVQPDHLPVRHDHKM